MVDNRPRNQVWKDGNKLTVTYGGAEGVTRKNCDYVGIHIIGKENTENFC